jgi:hypothetical protein
MPDAEFEPAIPARNRLHILALDRSVILIDSAYNRQR